MESRPLKRLLLILIAAWLSGLLIGVGLSYTGFYKDMAATGSVHFTEELAVTTISFPLPNEVLVGVTNNAKTEAGYLYKVNLFVNLEKRATVNMQWVSGEALGTEHLIRFTEIETEGISSIGVEVVR